MLSVTESEEDEFTSELDSSAISETAESITVEFRFSSVSLPDDDTVSETIESIAVELIV